MSGRDVRRVTAKASTSAHHDKQQLVTRLALGALENGVDKIYLGNEPFRINERAAEAIADKERVEVLNYPLSHTAADTEILTDLMWSKGCRVFIVLGGDGTNRIVAKSKPDAIILPLSTGTNNVFPFNVEASVAGAAAGLIASQTLNYQEYCERCKQIKVSVNKHFRDLALIDAVLLKNDHIGSLLPFKPENLSQIFLTRSEPASVGMSPIGGYVMPCNADDAFGVMLDCEGKTVHRLRAPLSPGLYGDISLSSIKKMPLGQTCQIRTPGILAFDGDRSIVLNEGDDVEITIQKDGPWVIHPQNILYTAAQNGLLSH
ncbi:MAG: NAD kinase [Candidatus Azotimanducaceae bacterium]|jgi:NAD kinase